MESITRMDAAIFEPYELNYFDMINLWSSKPATASSSSSSPMSQKVTERMESITKSVMQNLGPDGPGLLTVTDVPSSADLRRKLLPLARRLALLDPQDRTRLLKEQGLGSDVPLRNHNHDRKVSSFAMQLNYAHKFTDLEEDDDDEEDIDKIGEIFKKLGFRMMDVGHLLAQICDKFIGGHELEQSLSDSCSAKGRLIHYHSISENLAMRKNTAQAKRQLHLNSSEASLPDRIWQQWHYDYGLFTVLTSPIFLSTSHTNRTRTDDVTSGLEIFHPRRNQVLAVNLPPPDCFLVQVGESAEILSKGKLRANLHSVRRQMKMEDDLSRETFVVFLQPGWNQSFSISEEFIRNHHSSNNSALECKEFQKMVPPLLSRMKDGMTFAEFSKQTTQQYYGGKSGLQSSNR